MSKDLIRKVLSTVAIAFAVLACSGVSALAQTHRLTGTVVDQQGLPVVGASILIEGTSSGVVTDADGKYVFESISSDATIIVSCLGYVDQIRQVGGASVLDFTLAEDSEMLDAVVMVGYGVQKKSDVTGSISSLQGDELANRSVETVQSALSGKISGVQVFSATGAPGEDPQIRIRGFSSNNAGSSDPLYVVDGLKVTSIGYLDPSMIESMEVLKDGASAAIYGAEAGNGVVLITTKSGGHNKSRIFYDFSYGFTSLATHGDLMNAQQYFDYMTAAGMGSDAGIAGWDGVTETDWSEALYGEGGHIQRHTVGFEGGNDKGSIYAAMSYLDNDGMYYGDKDYMKRVTLQVNTTYDIKPWLEFTSNNSIEFSNYAKSSDGNGNIYYNSVYLYSPLMPVFYSANNLPSYMQGLISQYGDDMFMKNENGDYVAIPQAPIGSATNPMTLYYSQDSKHKDFNVRGVTALNFKPVKGLVVTTRLGYNFGAKDYNFYGVPTYFAVTSRTQDSYTARNDMSYRIDWENFANYNKTFNEKHDFSAMVGTAFHYRWSNYTQGTTNMFTGTGDNFHYLNYSHADAQDSVGGVVSINSSFSYFGRLGYIYDDRYSVQVSFRADAYDLSKLSEQARWGFFPSVSAGWTISNEPFMADVSKDAVSMLKIRASYGENGNVNVLSGFPYVSSLTTGDYYPFNGTVTGTITPSTVLSNPELTWETSKQWDAGIDTRFLSDRLSFTMDWYLKRTSGQLISMTSPLTSGTTTVTKNVGLVRNTGFEFDLGWKDTVGDFSYSINANLATLDNLVVSNGGAARIDNGGVFFDEGNPVWSFFGYRYLGPDPETGAAIYDDIDDSGNIDDSDKVYLGSAIPDFTYGVTFNAEYKGFDLTVFGSGSYGGELMFNASGTMGGSNHASVFWTDSWSVKGPGAKYPKPADNSDNFMGSSSMNMFDGSYFKIKQIALGYSIPARILQKAFISKLRVYVSLDNFFCFTKYPGLDPETINAVSGMGLDTGNTPTPKTVTVGVNLSF